MTKEPDGIFIKNISIEKYTILENNCIIIENEIFQKLKTIQKEQVTLETKSLIWSIEYCTPEDDFDIYVNEAYEAYEIYLILFPINHMSKAMDDCIFLSSNKMNEIIKSLKEN